MSALATFDKCCFSDWYMTIFQRTLFPCKTEEERKNWEEKVTSLFVLDRSAVSGRSVRSEAG